jgi:hypothetical protein
LPLQTTARLCLLAVRKPQAQTRYRSLLSSRFDGASSRQPNRPLSPKSPPQRNSTTPRNQHKPTP